MRTTLVLSACLLISTFAHAQSAYITQQAQLACGDPGVKFDVQRAPGRPRPTPTKDTAVVYILEPGMAVTHAMVGTPIYGFTHRIGLDGKWIGAVATGTYFAFPVPAGVHRLCTRGQSWMFGTVNLVSLTQLNARAGATYYFTPTFDQLDPDEAQLLLAWYMPAASTVQQQ
jgi:hypothetical protein